MWTGCLSSAELEIGKEVITPYHVNYNADGLLRTEQARTDCSQPEAGFLSLRCGYFIAQHGRSQEKSLEWPRDRRFACC